ncbi:MAG: hypothetical protein IJ248_08965 [Candidatus Methanomethylophilaceae archaeon]|nr:hypothetical protein [Candidatus Methanomethylophilaceae archaeon]
MKLKGIWMIVAVAIALAAISSVCTGFASSHSQISSDSNTIGSEYAYTEPYDDEEDFVWFMLFGSEGAEKTVSYKSTKTVAGLSSIKIVSPVQYVLLRVDSWESDFFGNEMQDLYTDYGISFDASIYEITTGSIYNDGEQDYSVTKSVNCPLSGTSEKVDYSYAVFDMDFNHTIALLELEEQDGQYVGILKVQYTASIWDSDIATAAAPPGFRNFTFNVHAMISSDEISSETIALGSYALSTPQRSEYGVRP